MGKPKVQDLAENLRDRRADSLGLTNDKNVAQAFDAQQRKATAPLHRHGTQDIDITGGDVDVDDNYAATIGEEAPGGQNPTSGQSIVEDYGRALGVTYQDNEPLHGKVNTRDEERWELNPASAEDYDERHRHP